MLFRSEDHRSHIITGFFALVKSRAHGFDIAKRHMTEARQQWHKRFAEGRFRRGRQRANVLFIIVGKKPLFNNHKKENLFLIFVFLIIFSVYLYRMVTLFPNIPPMDYNKNSLLYTIFSKIYSSINLK